MVKVNMTCDNLTTRKHIVCDTRYMLGSLLVIRIFGYILRVGVV
jgi:hypothetical protein